MTHLIVIMADQLRYDLIGPHTPHISALLAESCVFDRAYCASPLCVPARGAFFTGLHPNRTGCLINPWDPADAAFGRVKAGTPNLYTLLQDRFDAWHTGKQHLYTADRFDEQPDSPVKWRSLEKGYGPHCRSAGKRRPGGPAFTGIVPEMVGGQITRAKRYSIPHTGRYEHGIEYFFDGYITDQSLAALAERDRARPMFLSAMFLAPHPPLDIPDPWWSDAPAPAELPANVGVWSRGQSPLQLYNLTGAVGARYTRDQWHEPWRAYTALVMLLDDCVGRIIAELKRQGMYDDALIVFTSDHGEMLGSHCLWQKMCMYEESARAPIGFKPPRGTACVPGRRADLFSHVDALPTICDLLGLAPPPGLDGRSAAATVRQGRPFGRDELFIQFDGNGALGNFSRCLVRGGEKLIVDLFKDEVFFELYDLPADPQEQQNLAFAQPQRARAMLDRLCEAMLATGDRLTVSAADFERFLTAYGPYCA